MNIEKLDKSGRKKEFRWEQIKEWAKKHILAIALISSAVVITGVFLIAIYSIKYEQTASTDLQIPKKKATPK